MKPRSSQLRCRASPESGGHAKNAPVQRADTLPSSRSHSLSEPSHEKSKTKSLDATVPKSTVHKPKPKSTVTPTTSVSTGKSQSNPHTTTPLSLQYQHTQYELYISTVLSAEQSSPRFIQFSQETGGRVRPEATALPNSDLSGQRHWRTIRSAPPAHCSRYETKGIKDLDTIWIN